jgi:hypothetical protein
MLKIPASPKMLKKNMLKIPASLHFIILGPNPVTFFDHFIGEIANKMVKKGTGIGSGDMILS